VAIDLAGNEQNLTSNPAYAESFVSLRMFEQINSLLASRAALAAG
jgi:hypothetical protein